MKGTEDNCVFFLLHSTCVLKIWHGLSRCTLCLDDPGKLAPYSCLLQNEAFQVLGRAKTTRLLVHGFLCVCLLLINFQAKSYRADELSSLASKFSSLESNLACCRKVSANLVLAPRCLCKS